MSSDASKDQRVALLWQRPTIPDADIPDALGIPPSLWATQKADGDTPPLFTIGRRLFVRTVDLRAWLDEKAKTGLPGSRRKREAARKAEKVPA
jgi:hypothetical protein